MNQQNKFKAVVIGLTVLALLAWAVTVVVTSPDYDDVRAVCEVKTDSRLDYAYCVGTMAQGVDKYEFAALAIERHIWWIDILYIGEPVEGMLGMVVTASPEDMVQISDEALMNGLFWIRRYLYDHFSGFEYLKVVFVGDPYRMGEYAIGLLQTLRWDDLPNAQTVGILQPGFGALLDRKYVVWPGR